MQVNGKPVQVVATAAWNEKYGGLEAAMYTKEAVQCLIKHPVDMLIFEMPEEGVMQIRSAGYDLPTDSVLDEKTVLFKTESLPIETFWFKLDDYGDKYVGTFLFPSDY